MNERRPKGTGNIAPRGEGVWRLRYNAPQNENGERGKAITETVKGTKREAERVLRERLAAVENGAYVPKDKESVLEFMERWLKDYAAVNVSPKTLQGYRGFLRYIGPSIGHVALQGLTARHIQTMYAGMLDRGLSNSTVSQLHRIFKKALDDAVKWGLLVLNPVHRTSPPKQRRPQLEMWDIYTVHEFLDVAASSRFSDFYFLAVLTGLRRSELAGLRWENIDLARARLSVAETLQRLTGLGLVTGQPKTDRSRRTVALAPSALKLLRNIQGRQLEQRLEYGQLWQNTGYVFTQETGAPVDPDMVSKDFPRLIRKAGLPHLTFRGLRHAHASLALSAGINLKIVSERLGHAGVEITADIYSHVLPGMDAAAALAVEEVLQLQGDD